MGHPSTVKRLLVLALPLYVAAGSFGSALALQACRHTAEHHAMQHAGSNGGSCWCDDMTGGGFTLLPVTEALPAAVTFVATAMSQAVVPAVHVSPVPQSPSYPPTPPPPNGRAA
jgi:hypothetical protein